jgi:hypothetical protein
MSRVHSSHASAGDDTRPKVSFEHLVSKVARAEKVREMREQRLVGHYRQLGRTWREGWTPIRIIAVGLASCFLVGRAEPLRALTGARMLQMVGALSGLFASAQATFAAEQAEQAAGDAEEAASGQAMPGDAVSAPPGSEPPAGYVRPSSRASGTPDPAFASQPRAAEAATEESES